MVFLDSFEQQTLRFVVVVGIVLVVGVYELVLVLILIPLVLIVALMSLRIVSQVLMRLMKSVEMLMRLVHVV